MHRRSLDRSKKQSDPNGTLLLCRCSVIRGSWCVWSYRDRGVWGFLSIMQKAVGVEIAWSTTNHSSSRKFTLIVLASQIFRLRSDYKSLLFPRSNFFASSLLLHHFFFTLTMAPHHKRLSLYTMTLNDERRVTLTSCPSFLTTRLSIAFAPLAFFS
jgi:hypothetical protein